MEKRNQLSVRQQPAVRIAIRAARMAGRNPRLSVVNACRVAQRLDRWFKPGN